MSDHLDAGHAVAQLVTVAGCGRSTPRSRAGAPRRPADETVEDESRPGEATRPASSSSCRHPCAFAAIVEEGTAPLLGDDSDGAVIPANADVMVYGDGGAGKTTLCLDLGLPPRRRRRLARHRRPGAVHRPAVENEGPRPLFRGKVARKLAGWSDAVGGDLGDRFIIVEEPWARFTFADEAHRDRPRRRRSPTHDVDVVIVGPLAMAGMTEAGTLHEVRQFLALVADVRSRCGPSRHVRARPPREPAAARCRAPGRAPSTRCSTSSGWATAAPGSTSRRPAGRPHWHAQTLELRWEPGASFSVDSTPKLTDDDIAATMLRRDRSRAPASAGRRSRRQVTGCRPRSGARSATGCSRPARSSTSEPPPMAAAP